VDYPPPPDQEDTVGYDSTIYNIVLLLHILSVIIGFGGVMLNGVYAARARNLPPAESLAVLEVNTFVSLRVAELFIYATAVFGLGLVGLSDGVWAFSQLWVWLALVLYVVALGLSHGLLQPRVHQMVALQRELGAAGPPAGGPPPQATQLEQLGKQVGAVSGVLHLSMVAIICLMIWKPA
jgi:uncharacterized membrane protein